MERPLTLRFTDDQKPSIVWRVRRQSCAPSARRDALVCIPRVFLYARSGTKDLRALSSCPSCSSWFTSSLCPPLQARQVGHLEEERARGGRIGAAVEAFEHRAVAGVRDGAWHQLVRGEKVAEHPALRAVELRDRAEKEPRVELIRVP